MALNGHVHWHEGLFLRPHHLQLMQRGLRGSLAELRELTWAYPWGLVRAELSADALENMMVRFDRLHAVLPSGVEVRFPDSSDLPPLDISRAFESGPSGFTVLLGVPLWYQSRANSIELGEEADWRTKRIYRVGEAENADENTGENPQPLLVRRVNARLMLESDDQTDMEVMPLLRIVHATGEDVGMPRLDEGFIPSCMVLGGSPTLRDAVRDLVNQVEASRKELVARMRVGFSMDTIRGPQIEQLMRLTALNRFSGSLPSLIQSPSVTPFALYLQLRELLGELAALQPDRDQFDAPAYDHARPGVSFMDLLARIRGLLKGAVPPSFLKLGFARDGDTLSVQLEDTHLTTPTDYFLGVRTREDAQAVAKTVENADEFKLMAPSLLGRNIYGVKLSEERHPPLQLPAESGLHYFRLNRGESARMWERITQEKAMSIKWLGLEGSDYDVTLFMPIPGAEGAS